MPKNKNANKKSRDYPEGFESIWGNIDKPRSSGRKEQGYRVFCQVDMTLKRYVELFGRVRDIKNRLKNLSTSNSIERKSARLLIRELEIVLKEVQEAKPKLGIVE